MMEFRNISEFTPPDSGIAITLGRFDGVHVAHRALLERTVSFAHRNRLAPVCFSFCQGSCGHPEPYDCLTTDEEKIHLIENTGIEMLLHSPFEPPLIDTEPDVFVESFLIHRWKARFITVGYDFRFGKNRAGDSDFLKRLATHCGATVEILDPVKIDGEIVKATTIRMLLREGKISRANAFLGRPYSLTQRQVPGRHLGARIGFPTINFEWPDAKVMVPYGVYAVRIGTAASDVLADGVAGFGLRPTVEKDRPTPILEVHMPDSNPLPELLAPSEAPDKSSPSSSTSTSGRKRNSTPSRD